MLEENKIYAFLATTKDDARISAVHIALYLALIQKSMAYNNDKEIKVSRQEIMCLAKISSRQTYNKRIKELQEFGYIRYYPSYHQTAGAVIQLI